jgi:hypothetical protein
MLEKLPSLARQTLAVGTRFGQSVGENLRKKMIEELRKIRREPLSFLDLSRLPPGRPATSLSHSFLVPNQL